MQPDGRAEETGADGPLEEVFVARHAETEWNRLGRRQGQLDSPLTAAGRHHAERLAARLVGLGIDGVFASPLGRAVTTAEVCGRALGRPVVLVDELAEVHHGAMAGLTSTEIERAFPGQMALRAANRYGWRFPDGESYADADRRAAVALRRIAATRSPPPACRVARDVRSDAPAHPRRRRSGDRARVEPSPRRRLSGRRGDPHHDRAPRRWVERRRRAGVGGASQRLVTGTRPDQRSISPDRQHSQATWPGTVVSGSARQGPERRPGQREGASSRAGS